MKHLICLIMSLLPCVQTALAQDTAAVLYPPADWAGIAPKSLNLSAFVFNDCNRNGVYDLGDRAMASILVGLAREGVGVAMEPSNANGFANFPAQLGKADAPINQAGTYAFRVVPPPGWSLTSGLIEQVSIAAEIPGSPAGLGLDQMPRPFGLARDLFIHGWYAGAGTGRLELLRNGQPFLGGELNSGDDFYFKVSAGSYTLSDGISRRDLTLIDEPVDLGMFDTTNVSAPVRLVDFDDVSDIGLVKIPSGYGGLDWFNLNAIRRDFINSAQGLVNGVTSGSFSAYTSSGLPAEISRRQPFTLAGMNLSAAWRESEGETAIVQLFAGERLIRTDRISVSMLGPVRYAPNVSGITRIRLSTAHAWQLVIDDLEWSD